MTTKTQQTGQQGFTYGVAPGVHVPADFPQIIRQFDVHARYRRPSFDSQGNRRRDAQGHPAWDESVVPCRDHFRTVEKGFEFLGPFIDAPEDLRRQLDADPRSASLVA